MSDLSDGSSRLEKATESTIAKAFNRFVTPAMVGIIGWFLLQTLNDIKQKQETAAIAADEQGNQFQEVKTEVKLLNAKVDFSVLQQIDSLKKRVDNLEQTPRPTYRVDQ